MKENYILKIVSDPRYVEFLKLLIEENSISGAAKATGISYRKAWNIVEELREFFGKEIIQTRIGGSGGGGTYLTEAGGKIIEYLISINENFNKEINRFLGSKHLDLFLGLISRYRVRTSARNQLYGIIKDINGNDVTSQIKVDVNGIFFNVILTKKSVAELGIKRGKEVYLLIKAPQVLLSKEKQNCINSFQGKIVRITTEQGEIERYCETEISIFDKVNLISITGEKQNIQPGDLIWVCIQPKEIIIGV